MGGTPDPATAANYYGYQTDYAKRSALVRLYHQTGEQGDPLHYTDQSDIGNMPWTTDPGSLHGDDLAHKMASDSIDKVNQRIMAQSKQNVVDAAISWGQLQSALETVATTIGQHSDALHGGTAKVHAWRSPAADEFFAKGPGAALKSLNDWHEAAGQNSLAMWKLWSIIDTYQTQMAALYQQYLAALGSATAVWNRISSQSHDEHKYETGTLANQDEFNRNRYVDLMKKVRNGTLTFDLQGDPIEQSVLMQVGNTNWSMLAFQLEYAMANEYGQVMSNYLYSGGRAEKYEGPTDAVSVDQSVVAKLLAPSLGSLGRVSPPTITAPVFDIPPLQPLPPTAPVPQPDPQPGSPTAPAPPPVVVEPAPVGTVPVLPPLFPLPGQGTATAPTGLVPPALGGAGLSGGTGLLGGLGNAGAGVGTASTQGLISNPAAGSGFNLPPGGLGRPPSLTQRGLRRGVLGANRGTPPGDGEPETGRPPGLGAPPGQQGRRAPGEPAESRLSGAPGLDDELTSVPSVPTSAPVLGRPAGTRPGATPPDISRRADLRLGAASGEPPAGTARPVLHGSAAGSLPPAPPPGTSRRAPAGSPSMPGPPPLPGDNDWVTAPGVPTAGGAWSTAPGVAPPVEPPTPSRAVLDGSGRPTNAQRAGGVWNDEFSPPTTRGAGAPVLGRPTSADSSNDTQRPGTARRKTADSDLATRRMTTTDDAVTPVAGEEEAFTMDTPGGPVLGALPVQRVAEPAPKPTLGAG